jgi:hypothetical protein
MEEGMTPMIARTVWVRGLIAGTLGAAAMALWFLVIDAAQGAPFRTPGLLASSLFGAEEFESRPGLIALYTVVHFAALMAVGVAVTWVLQWMKAAPGILLGLVVGFILFDIVFYASMYVTGIDVVAELGWVEVLVGNIIAGMSIMGYLHVTATVRAVTWWEALADHRIVREGLVAGVIGAVAVAGWFLVVDLIQGRPLFTPAALGSALFLGATDLAMVEINLWTVLGYSFLHFGAFAAVGLVASVIVSEAENAPPMILGAILLFVVFEALFLGLLAVVAEFLLGPIAWWSIALGNLIAVCAMGYYLWRKHPGLREAMSADPFDHTY